MRFFYSFTLCVTMASGVLAADRSIDEPAVQQSVARSIAWLESDMRNWREERGCAACHHGPMYLWSISAAKHRGYTVNDELLKDMTQWLLNDDESHVFPRVTIPVKGAAESSTPSDRMSAAMMGHKNLSQPTIYLLHALKALPDEEPMKLIGWRKAVNHLAAAQADDGSFVGRNAWRPIFNTPQILTRIVVTGLQDGPELQNLRLVAETQRTLFTKAKAYIQNGAPDDSQQGLVLQLLQESLKIEPQSSSKESLVHRLVKLQRPDGGWSQTEDRESDAFATGQALAALHKAGIPSSAANVRHGIDYLLRTQQENGTWRMTSRPNPETGKPAELLNPITYAATAWAVLGLTSHVPGTKR